MEVHHPHHPTHKKKWSEYIIEFVMLFTAVTLGFFAENIREGIAEKHKKQETLEAVAVDFEKDLKGLAFHKSFNLERIKICDSLFDLVNLPADKIEQSLYYRLIGVMPNTLPFSSNSKSRHEAETKGYFSSVGDEELATSIIEYEFWLNDLNELFHTDVTTLSSFIDNKEINYVNPILYKISARRPMVELPYKMGIAKIADKDVKDLQVLLANKLTLLDISNQNIDSLEFYAKNVIKILHREQD